MTLQKVVENCFVSIVSDCYNLIKLVYSISKQTALNNFFLEKKRQNCSFVRKQKIKIEIQSNDGPKKKKLLKTIWKNLYDLIKFDKSYKNYDICKEKSQN